jgi:hypothetical protein
VVSSWGVPGDMARTIAVAMPPVIPILAPNERCAPAISL